MQKVALGSRILLGLIYVVFGLNGFFHFIPIPPSTPEAGELLGALFKAGYFFPFLKGCEVILGALLLSGFYAPLALVMLFPITLNIFLFHVILDPKGSAMAIIMLLIHLFLAYCYRKSWSSLFQNKVELK